MLERVGSSNAHSDDLLHGPAASQLSQPDRNLAMALVLGVLRWQIALDARIRPLLQRPDASLESPVATALRMGAFQLLHLDRIPAHAALSESVELVRAAGHAHAAGMVNAVLRKLTREPAPLPKLYETTAALAERLSHPGWLVDRWTHHYGRNVAKHICEHDQKPPGEALLFRDPETPEPQPGSMAVSSPTDLRMDDGSRLVAELAAAVRPGARRIWDCCAAPGGKTLILALRHPQAEILATDIHPRRVQALADRLIPVAPRARTLQADAAALPDSAGEFDLILCDVPCSGTGTLARNPEIKQRLSPQDLPRQAERQQTILSAALQRLAPGGKLVYSTCSLEPEENEQVIEAVLAAKSAAYPLSRVPVDPYLQFLRSGGVLRPDAALDGVVRDGALRTLPGPGFAGDGFFAVVLARD